MVITVLSKRKGTDTERKSNYYRCLSKYAAESAIKFLKYIKYKKITQDLYTTAA